jgi:hypothetical protein
LIDNRIVDLKPAVPEGAASGSTSPKEASFNMNMFGEQSYGAWYDAGVYGSGMPWWVGDPTEKMMGQQSQGLDCLDILSATRGLPLHSFAAPAHDQLDETGYLVSHHMPETETCTQSESQRSPQGASAALSANAPEFVPSGAQVPADVRRCTEAKSSPLAAGATPPTNARKASKTRHPLGELTNIVEVEDLLKPFKSPNNKTADIGHGHLSTPADEDASPSSAAAETPDVTGVSKLQRPEDLVLCEKASSNELSPNDSSTVASSFSPPLEEGRQDRSKNISDDDDNTEASDEDAESSLESVTVDMECLPSVGSALHGTGECKRCNFFPKGRCQNGKDCSFCHFPHDKRKPSRQEKRERRAAWLEAHNMEVETKDLTEYVDEANHGKPCQALQLARSSAPLTQGKFVVYQDEDVCSDETMAYSIFPGLPPIRAAKLPAPLPLPGTMDTLGPTSLALPPGLAPPQLSVQPWQPEAESSPIAMLTTTPQMSGHFDQHALQKVVSSTAITSAPLSTAPSPVATPTAHRLSPPLCTIGTQTNEDYMCHDCEDLIPSDVKAELDGEKQSDRWSRDELLRLRSGSFATQAGEVSTLRSMKTAAIPSM